MNRKERREQERAMERANRQAERYAKMVVDRANAKNAMIARMEQNGITIADLERNYEKGYTAGFNAASEPMYRMMMAAICLALNDLHGFGKKRLKDVLQAVDQKVLYSLTSVELVDEVFEKTGLEIVFHDTFDRIQEKE